MQVFQYLPILLLITIASSHNLHRFLSRYFVEITIALSKSIGRYSRDSVRRFDERQSIYPNSIRTRNRTPTGLINNPVSGHDGNFHRATEPPKHSDVQYQRAVFMIHHHHTHLKYSITFEGQVKDLEFGNLVKVFDAHLKATHNWHDKLSPRAVTEEIVGT